MISESLNNSFLFSTFTHNSNTSISSLLINGSYIRKFLTQNHFSLEYTFFQILPNQIIDIVFQDISFHIYSNLFSNHSNQKLSFLERFKIPEITKSATLSELAHGVFNTFIFLFLHSSKSILSSQTHILNTNFRLEYSNNNFLSTFIQERIIITSIF